MNRDNNSPADRQRQLLDDLDRYLDARQDVLLQTLDRLAALREAVIRRDETGLGQLLEQVRQDAEPQRRLDALQRQLERRLAEAFDTLDGPITLSGLCACLEDDCRDALRQKQQTLLDLAGRVQNETQATELLLRECARCNRLLLGAILGDKKQTETYDPQGQRQQDVQHGLVSVTL